MGHKPEKNSLKQHCMDPSSQHLFRLHCNSYIGQPILPGNRNAPRSDPTLSAYNLLPSLQAPLVGSTG